MGNQRFILVTSLVSLVALTGAGCADKMIKKSPGRSSDSSSSESRDSKDEYKGAVDLELPEESSQKANAGIQRMVEKLFDDVKITSFLNHFPGEGGLSVEYTTKRAITQSDFNDFLKLLKTEKYVVEQSGINDGEISIAAKSSDTYLIVAMKINEQKVNVVLMPTDFTGSEE
jgi:hypothetical protein